MLQEKAWPLNPCRFVLQTHNTIKFNSFVYIQIVEIVHFPSHVQFL